jgi:lipopolysaccharide export system protein LptA
MKHSHNLHRLFILLTCIACLNSSQTLALPDDREQPINVSADSAFKSEKSGTTVYKGNVIITQGSIHISGDKISIFDQAGTVTKMIAEGKPAKFKQKPEVNSADVIANGFTIEYDINAETLLLLENALLKQESRTTNSNKITYDMKTEVVNAGDNTGRVIMVLEPSPKAQK